MRYLILIITILTFFIAGSCGKKCPCYPARIYLNYIDFKVSETDTITVRRYIKGSGFLSLYDTGIISVTNSGYYPHTDTMHIRTDIESLILRSDYDYELFLPVPNKISRIHDIQEEFREDGCISRNLNGCINQINAFKLDNQPVSFDHDYPNVYIRK
jgi:Fe-S-cluster containining protein